jgi:hypothetical protein
MPPQLLAFALLFATRRRNGHVTLAVLAGIVSVTVVSAALVAPTAYQPQAVTFAGRDPALAAAVYGGMGLVVLFFAKLGIDLKASVERLSLRVDDPQTGLVSTVQAHIHETRGAVGALANEVEDIQQQVAGIVATCAANHARGREAAAP